MPVIEIYTQPYCPFCVRAVRLLTEKGVAFKEIDAPRGSPERHASIERSGGRTSVPQIFIDGKHIGGCDDMMNLDAKGELNLLLGR